MALASDPSGFSLQFDAIKGNWTETGVFMGLDDIDIRIGTCAAPINCNFEDSTICSWTQYKNDDMDWMLNQGETVSPIFKLAFQAALILSLSC